MEKDMLLKKIENDKLIRDKSSDDDVSKIPDYIFKNMNKQIFMMTIL